ncbi:hypothetical protein [Nocardia sp. NPDC057440]|uniref:hypothetical protein n=1 Tax=Nocardia sp. NPDC057440 TaxID=3346134 RepID=UPI0036705917
MFDGFPKGTKPAGSMLGLRFLWTDTAVVTSRGDTYKGAPKSPEDLSKTQTYSTVRQDSHWRITAFHNTQRKNVMERISFPYDPDTRPAAER